MIRFMIFLSFLLLAQSAFADWVDDWVDNTVAVYSGPSYYESGQRGYVSFGNLSVRSGFVSDQIASFQPPKISIGCGGIDVFLGGFHFMDFDYLVQQAQNIISSAPYFAFQFALRSISKEAGSIIDTAKSISDLLNQTQYNSCALSQRLGYAAASLVPQDTYKAAGQFLKDAIPKVEFKADNSSLAYRVLRNIFDTNNGIPPAPDNQQTNNGCPSDFLLILQTGSLLKYIHSNYFPGSDKDSLENLVRGYVGDITFEHVNGFWFAHLVPSCGAENEEKSFKAFVEGVAEEKPITAGVGGACTLSSVTPLKTKVSNVLQNAYNALMTGSSLSATEVNWLRVLPLPILNYMKQLYIYQANPVAIQSLVDPAAYGFGYSIMQIIYAEITKAIRFIQENKVKACQGNVPPDRNCYLCEHDTSIDTALKEYQQRVLYASEKARAVWMLEQKNLARVNDLILLLQEINDTAVRTKLSNP